MKLPVLSNSSSIEIPYWLVLLVIGVYIVKHTSDAIGAIAAAFGPVSRWRREQEQLAILKLRYEIEALSKDHTLREPMPPTTPEKRSVADWLVMGSVIFALFGFGILIVIVMGVFFSGLYQYFFTPDADQTGAILKMLIGAGFMMWFGVGIASAIGKANAQTPDVRKAYSGTGVARRE